MNGCMIPHASIDEYDRAREEWFQNIDVRKREREEGAKKNREGREQMKDWWREYGEQRGMTEKFETEVDAKREPTSR